MIEISGLTPFTTIDYPGNLSAVLFCQGCPWRCGYCHNPLLQPFGRGSISWDSVLEFLEERKGLLDAVVFSGGEPSMQIKLPVAMEQIQKMGFKIGIHTAGIHSHSLKRVLPFANWVGMDIKAPFKEYGRITKAIRSGDQAQECARLIIESGAEYEFRTTVHPNLLSPMDIDLLTEQLALMGAKWFVLQRFRPEGCNNAELNHSPFGIHWESEFLERIKVRFERFFVR